MLGFSITEKFTRKISSGQSKADQKKSGLELIIILAVLKVSLTLNSEKFTLNSSIKIVIY